MTTLAPPGPAVRRLLGTANALMAPALEARASMDRARGAVHIGNIRSAMQVAGVHIQHEMDTTHATAADTVARWKHEGPPPELAAFDPESSVIVEALNRAAEQLEAQRPAEGRIGPSGNGRGNGPPERW